MKKKMEGSARLQTNEIFSDKGECDEKTGASQ
jgi:hypothetical protein